MFDVELLLSGLLDVVEVTCVQFGPQEGKSGTVLRHMFSHQSHPVMETAQTSHAGLTSRHLSLLSTLLSAPHQASLLKEERFE